MSNVNLRICDRCRTELGSNEGQSIEIGYHHPAKLDLCRNCMKKFVDWFKEPEGVHPLFKGGSKSKIKPPPDLGYDPDEFEWVIPPCPHHVPCADPQGCLPKVLQRKRD